MRPLQSSSAANVAAAAATGKKTIEEMYQKKTQLEHILLRPDTYVGSVEKHTQTLWVYENDEMVHRAVSYVPGLYKIFDEILVNAADNKQRDPSMDALKVTINAEANTVSVFNNGDGVPVEIHHKKDFIHHQKDLILDSARVSKVSASTTLCSSDMTSLIYSLLPLT